MATARSMMQGSPAAAILLVGISTRSQEESAHVRVAALGSSLQGHNATHKYGLVVCCEHLCYGLCYGADEYWSPEAQIGIREERWRRRPAVIHA